MLSPFSLFHPFTQTISKSKFNNALILPINPFGLGSLNCNLYVLPTKNSKGF